MRHQQAQAKWRRAQNALQDAALLQQRGSRKMFGTGCALV